MPKCIEKVIYKVAFLRNLADIAGLRFLGFLKYTLGAVPEVFLNSIFYHAIVHTLALVQLFWKKSVQKTFLLG